MRDITHFLLATLLSLATLACRHDTPPADGSLSRQLPPDTKEILRQLNDRDNREEALRLADSLAALPPSDDPWLEIRIAQAVANTLYKFRRDPSDAIRVQERALAVYRLHPDAADDPADLLSTLGHYYRRKGMREKEVEVIQEAMDWCVAHPEKLNRGLSTPSPTSPPPIATSDCTTRLWRPSHAPSTTPSSWIVLPSATSTG